MVGHQAKPRTESQVAIEARMGQLPNSRFAGRAISTTPL